MGPAYPERRRPSGRPSGASGSAPRSSLVNHRSSPLSPWRSTFAYRTQSTATDNAVQISRMRSSPNLPRRSVSVPIETLSTESRFTADRSGIGSSPGSSGTSLASPRIVVVHGAISALRSLGMAASRERTTTGRRAISGRSHHHTSPLAGRSFTTTRQPGETMPSRPIRQTHRVEGRHKQRRRRQFRLLDAGSPARPELHREGLRRSSPTSVASHLRGATRPRWC